MQQKKINRQQKVTVDERLVKLKNNIIKILLSTVLIKEGK